MALSEDDKKDMAGFLDGWLAQAATHIQKAIVDGKATPPAPPKNDPAPADPAPSDPPSDPPPDPVTNLFKASKMWFGDRA